MDHGGGPTMRDPPCIGPTMLVTGCSTGLGRATCMHFASKGWAVYATVRRQVDADNLLLEWQPNSAAHILVPIICDATDDESVRGCVAVVSARCGARGLNVLINNAGIALFGPLELSTLAQWQQVFAINVFGVATVTRHCLPLLRLAAATEGRGGGGGRIIIIGSAAGKMAAPLQSIYSASKFAVEGLTDSLRAELAGQRIKVVLMQLGAVATAMAGKIRAASLPALGCTDSTDSTDPGVRALYSEGIQETLQMFESLETGTIPMQVVLKSLDKAVTRRKPPTRIAVDGAIAFALWVRWALGDCAWDSFFKWAQGQARKGAKSSKGNKAA